MNIGLRYEPKTTRCAIQTGHPAPMEIPGMRKLWEIYPDYAWAGEPCFVLGGGPSLKGFDPARLAGKKVIGTNRAFETFSCQICVCCDRQFLRNVKAGVIPYGPEAAQKYREFKGVFAWACNKANMDMGREVFWLHTTMPTISFVQKDGLKMASNSGFVAVNLAAALGCNPIYLLGFDMKGDGTGKQVWYHSGHVNRQKEIVYKSFIREFNINAEKFAAHGCRIINLNPDSALQCFEFGNIDEALS